MAKVQWRRNENDEDVHEGCVAEAKADTPEEKTTTQWRNITRIKVRVAHLI